MTYWEHRITRPNQPAVPIRIKRMQHTFWAPPRYEALCRYLATHPSVTLRDAAEATGYSKTGLVHALERLRSWGAVVLKSTRGRLGRTLVRLQSDVATVNVPTTGERIFLRPSLRLSVVGTFSPKTVFASWEEMRAAAGLPS